MTSRRVRGAVRLRALQLAAALAVVFLWWASASAELVRPALLPPFAEFVSRLADITRSPELWGAIAATSFAAVAGTAIAAAISIPLGLVLGTSPAAERSTRLLLDVGRSFPVVALLPVLLLVLGATTRMKVTVIVIACVFPLVIQTLNGARRLEATVVSTVRGYRLPWLLRFRKVLLPQAAPFIATGMRIAITTAVLVAVGTEVLTQTPGIGRRITLAQAGGQTALSYAYIFYAAMLGVLLNGAVTVLESKLIPWQHEQEKRANDG